MFSLSLFKVTKKPAGKIPLTSSIKKKNASFMSLEATRKIWYGN
tara:strand:- start:529 stop:660 length:132 start_codon:yes stop_codon:yes gene_type:complete